MHEGFVWHPPEEVTELRWWCEFLSAWGFVGWFASHDLARAMVSRDLQQIIDAVNANFSSMSEAIKKNLEMLATKVHNQGCSLETLSVHIDRMRKRLH